MRKRSFRRWRKACEQMIFDASNRVRLKFVTACLCELGDRATQQDRVDWREGQNGLFTWAVADGLGGHDGGDVAADLAVSAALLAVSLSEPGAVLANTVAVGLSSACEQVEAEQKHLADPGRARQMATTLALLVSDGYRVAWGHTGDTRIYRLRNGRAQRLTQDHTLRAAIGLDDNDKVRVPSSLTSAIGLEAPRLDVSDEENLARGDLFLICTDCLWEHVALDALCKFARETRSVSAWLTRLAGCVQRAGAAQQDNYSAIAAIAVSDVQDESSALCQTAGPWWRVVLNVAGSGGN